MFKREKVFLQNKKKSPGGKVGMWPVIEFERNSKHHKKGETLFNDISCNSNFFCNLLDQSVLSLDV